jgi:hypothetical protein
MSTEGMDPQQEALLIEEADAWFEYLEATRPHAGSVRYEEIESWAWARLAQRLRALRVRRGRLRPAAV